jgi:ribose transport system ATP-binding protein
MEHDATTQTPSDAVLILQDVSKDFQGQRALDGVNLELRRGEVHALLGQNGCGKSTLIKVLAGYHQPEKGASALLDGQPLDLGSSAAARDGGIRFIHQDLGLVPDLDVVDNLAMGAQYAGRRWLSDKRERAAARQLLEDYGVDVDVCAPLGTLSSVQRTMVAIVRALRSGMKACTVLVLDEPTASLPSHEVEHLFTLIRRLQSQGGTVLYVTHRLGEVFQIADRVTVLRDGRRVATEEVRALDHDRLVQLIIGRPLQALYPEIPQPRAEVALVVENLRGESVSDLSLEVHAGEIVGVTGLVGSGYEDALQLIFGGKDRAAGTVRLGNAEVASGSPTSAIGAGLAFAPADRQRLSAIPAWSLRENITLPKLNTRGGVKWLSYSDEQTEAHNWLCQLGVTPPDPELALSALSGGNQQRVVLARWLRCGAKVLMLEEPTNGVDIGAKKAIYEALATAAAAGTAIVLSTSDADEASAICDRVLVMRNGVVAATLQGSALTADALLAESLKEDVVGAR